MKKLFICSLFALVFINSFAAVTVTPGTLPPANVKHPYSQLLQAQGGRKPYTWTTPTGTLPTGLILTSGTQMNANLAGTPTAAGTFTFTVRATDATGASATNSYTIVVTQLTFTDQQATDVWCRSVPDCPGIWDTWNSFYNLSSGTPIATPTLVTTTVTPTDTISVMRKNSGGAYFKTTVTGLNTIIGAYTPSCTGNYQFLVNSNKYTHLTTAADGNTTINNAGTYSFTSTGLHTVASPTVSFSGLVGVGTTAPGASIATLGTGSTSATWNILAANSASVTVLGVRNDGLLYVGNLSNGSLSIGAGSSYNSTLLLNTFIGTNTGVSITSGHDNTFIGGNAGNATSNGLNSVYIGADCGYGVNGNYNTATGWRAMYAASNGYNCAYGYRSLANTSGDENSAYGFSSGVTLTTGTKNCFYGASSGQNSTSAFRNIYLGYASGFNQTTGDDQLIIHNRDAGSSANELTKSLIYGVFADATADQQLSINALKILMPYIPAYANNAAALAVLGAGALYYTDVAGEYMIKLTH